jgi:hypothetical protein
MLRSLAEGAFKKASLLREVPTREAEGVKETY